MSDREFVVFGDWRDIRGAIEAVVPDYAKKPESEQKQIWNFASNLFANFWPLKAKCIGCGEIIHARSAYRCADCGAHLCENCIRPHFGPDHKPHR